MKRFWQSKTKERFKAHLGLFPSSFGQTGIYDKNRHKMLLIIHVLLPSRKKIRKSNAQIYSKGQKGHFLVLFWQFCSIFEQIRMFHKNKVHYLGVNMFLHINAETFREKWSKLKQE